jgi:GNAT superfamily N-acetyltransferase
VVLNPSSVTLRQLDGTEPELVKFVCRDYRQPWTEYIEEAIQGHVPSLLADGYQALGAWIDERLVGVTIYKPSMPSWRVALIAVVDGFHRRGVGTAMKTSVLRTAQAAGAAEVVSYVAFANDSMINLNVSLGAEIRQDPEEFNQLICLIRLQ